MEPLSVHLMCVLLQYAYVHLLMYILFSNCRSEDENKGKRAEFPTRYQGKLGRIGTLANTLSEPCSHHIYTGVNQRATPLLELFKIQLIIFR